VDEVLVLGRDLRRGVTSPYDGANGHDLRLLGLPAIRDGLDDFCVLNEHVPTRA
jgi:hypothetical protein